MELLNKPKGNVKKQTPMTTSMSGSQMSSYESENEKFYRTAECAYFKAEARGFEPGHEMEDWLAAEAEEKQCVQH
ncbi:hypothetical protein GALL_17960 [mine drainage metagenome]|uniref:DUF2934 domain-containing protein n=1 Tax=mine drainage metagenome TaxID=410659 RepID=A0A1J5T9P5_9ZZZZ